MWGAQAFIYTVYLTYGCVVYQLQGQYSFNPSYQGVSIYGWQTAGNMVTLIAALIAGGLYGNIGIKVLQQHLHRHIQHAAAYDKTREDLLRSPGPSLVDHRPRHRRLHPRLLTALSV